MANAGCEVFELPYENETASETWPLRVKEIF